MVKSGSWLRYIKLSIMFEISTRFNWKEWWLARNARPNPRVDERGKAARLFFQVTPQCNALHSEEKCRMHCIFKWPIMTSYFYDLYSYRYGGHSHQYMYLCSLKICSRWSKLFLLFVLYSISPSVYAFIFRKSEAVWMSNPHRPIWQERYFWYRWKVIPALVGLCQ